MQHQLQQNKAFWDKATPYHLESDFYELQAFKQGKEMLREIELVALNDVNGKTLLHLQCHFGQDTLCWQRKGAQCTGVDFSEAAIDAAQRLAEDLNLPSRFVCSDIYKFQGDKYDIVYTSYGVLGWLYDLKRWAAVVAAHLKPGGTFFIAEFHPFWHLYDENFTQIAYSYFNSDYVEEESVGSYADRDAPFQQTTFYRNFTMSEVIMALMEAELTIVDFREYDFSPYKLGDNYIETSPNRFQISGLEGKIPLAFSLKCIKK